MRGGGPAGSHEAQVQVGLLDAPVRGHVLGLVVLHVLLHGGEAGAVLLADGALVGRGAVVGAQVLNHGRVVTGTLVAQLTLKRLLSWGGRGRGGEIDSMLHSGHLYEVYGIQ